MSLFLMLAFLFFMGCVLGWGLEVVYRRFKPSNLERKWINPGFLTGPYLPLYGFGLCALFLLANMEGIVVRFEETAFNKISLFVLMSIVMTLLEYVAGLIFIKGMKIKLWDYSNERFNVQGIICLRFSIYWAMLGAFYYFAIHPRIIEALTWFTHNLAFSFVVGMFYGVFMVDLCYSFGIVTKVRHFAIDNEILVRYEELKREIRQDAAARRQKVHFMFSFTSETPLREHLSRYMDLNRAFEVTNANILGELQDAIEDQRAEFREEFLERKQESITDLADKGNINIKH